MYVPTYVHRFPCLSVFISWLCLVSTYVRTYVVSLVHRYLFSGFVYCFVYHTGEKASQQVEYQLPGRTGS